MNKKNKKIIATIECRMTSSRLPGKVILEAGGKPMIQILIERLKKVPQLKEIVLATTVNRDDDILVEKAQKAGIPYFRGSEEDVLKRVLHAAKSVKGDIIVEITGDCPLIDPEIVSQVIDTYLENDCDYASNLDPIRFPIGMDTQVFSTSLLELADKETESKEDREHVSWFIRRQPERFRKIHFPPPPSLRWPELEITLDEKKDYLLIKKIYEHFSRKNPDFTCSDIVAFLRANPELLKINSDVRRKNMSVAQ